MKKLVGLLIVLAAAGGCRTHCTNSTIFSMGEKGCRDKCIEKPALQCDCDSNCPCHEHKEWQKEKARARATASPK